MIMALVLFVAGMLLFVLGELQVYIVVGAFDLLAWFIESPILALVSIILIALSLKRIFTFFKKK